MATPIEVARLATQSRAIYSRLCEGPATNHELAALSLKYTSRISDLRKQGYDIKVISRNYATGLVTYVLITALAAPVPALATAA